MSGAAELIDGPLERPALAGNLRDLERVNRLLGGAEISWRALARYLTTTAGQGPPLTLLDVGTGAADIPRGLLRRASSRQLQLEISATDVRPEIIELARLRAPPVPGLELRLAPGDHLDPDDASFDVVHSSMVLHHLEPAAAVGLLAEMRRVARRAVIVNDLDRGRHWWLLARLLVALTTRNAYTRHDAPLSVRRAYRAAEVRTLAARAGLVQRASHWTFPAYRYALVFEHDE